MDSEEVLRIKTLIRRCEARSGAATKGCLLGLGARGLPLPLPLLRRRATKAAGLPCAGANAGLQQL